MSVVLKLWPAGPSWPVKSWTLKPFETIRSPVTSFDAETDFKLNIIIIKDPGLSELHLSGSTWLVRCFPVPSSGTGLGLFVFSNIGCLSKY